MLIKTTIQRSHIIAACIVAPDSDIRYYLNGVLVEVNQDCTFVAATDGSRLAAFRNDADGDCILPDGRPVEFIVPRSLALKVKPHKHLDIVWVEYDTESTMVTINDCGARSSENAIEGKFPDFRRVLPRQSDGVAQQIDPKLYASFGKIAQALGTKGSDAMHVWHDKSGFCTITVYGHPEFIGVCMAIRDRDADSRTFPSMERFQRPEVKQPEAIAA